MTVHFVGAGPGAADLLTLRASRLLAATDVCLYPGTYIDSDILSHCGAGTELIDTQGLNLDQIIEHIAGAHRAGRDVVRLCSGDPSIYSALFEQTRRLDAAGISWDVTPGIAAYTAAAAHIGAELTVPEVAQSIVLTRAQARSTAMPPGEKLAAFAQTGSTLVLHLAITRMRELATELAEYYGRDCPVVVAARVSQPAQTILRGTLAGIAGQVDEAGLRQAAIIMVGPALSTDPAGAESFLYDARRDRSERSAGS